MNNDKLIYIKYNGTDSNNLNIYEFFFSDNPEKAWGDYWDEQTPSSCIDLTPFEYTYVKKLKTENTLMCAQENSCFPFFYVKYGIMCLSAEDIREYTEYPMPIRLVFHFADSYKSVIEQFKQRDLEFEKDDNDNITNTIIEDEIDF